MHTGATAWRTLEYQNDSLGVTRLLTAMKDDGAFLLEGHSYDAQDRGTSSVSQAGRDNVTVLYGGPGVPGLPVTGASKVTHTIDGSTSQVSYFTLTYQGGRFLPLYIEGVCSTCGGASGDTQAFSYSASNFLLSKTDGAGQTTSFLVDANGNVTQKTEPDTPARVTTYEYTYAAWPRFLTRMLEPSAGKPGQQKIITNSWNTGETQLTTSVSGFLKSTDPSPTVYTTTTLFDSRHRQTEVDGPATNQKTTYSYFADAATNNGGRLQQTSLYTSGTAHLDTSFDTYDVFGTAKKILDPNLVEMDKITDSRGRVTSVTSLHVTGDSSESTDYTTTYTYDSRDRLMDVTLPRANKLHYGYEDGTNRLLDTVRVDSSGNQQERLHLTLNLIGDKVQEDAQVCNTPAVNCAAWTTKRSDSFAYDTRNRLSSITHPDATHIDYAYDARGNLKTIKDENHTSPNTTYAYDNLNRLISVTQTLTGAPSVSGSCPASAGTIPTCYAYDVLDNLKSVTDPNGNQTTYSYDDFRRMQSQVSPVSGTTTYSYDAAGNLTSSMDANTATTTRTYDAANRILSASSARSGFATENLNWAYDDTVANHYGKARLASMTDPSGSTTYSYDRRGLIKREARTIDLNTYTLAFGYDANANRSSIQYPTGRVVSYSFDFADRPSSAASGSTSYVTAATYQPFGPESTLIYGTSPAMTRTMTYDQRYRPTELKLQGSSTIYDYFYGEDAVGNITSICATSGACTTPTGAYDRVFAYDDLNRLTTAKSGSSLWGTATGNGYTYDSMGNVKTLTLGTSGTFRTATFAYSGTTPKLTSTTESGGLGTRTVAYDAAGNEITVGSGTFTYSPRNYLTSGDGLAYGYDGRGLRVVTTRTGVTLFPVRLVLNPISVQAGTTAVTVTGTVTLNDTTGGTVTLSSSDSTVASVPATVGVSSGLNSANFSVTTFAVAGDKQVTITATLNGVAVTAVLNVTAAAKLVLLSFSPRTVHGGNPSTGTVTLNGGAPSGTSVDLTSGISGVVSVPGNIPITAGQTSASFTATTFTVTSSNAVDVSATLKFNGNAQPGTQHASLVVVPYAVELRRPSGEPLRLASLGWNREFTATLSGPPDWELTHSLRPGWLADATATDSNSGVATASVTEAIEAALAASPPGPPKRNYIYSPEMNLLAESELSWPREKTILYEYIWFNGHPVAQIDGTTVTHWTFTDHLGTPLIQTTASQAVWWRAEYEPYGRVWTLTTTDQHQPLRLPGQEAEQFNLGSNGSTERFYNVFRWYRAPWGRYTQTDPLQPGGLGLFSESSLLSFPTLPLRSSRLDRAELAPIAYSHLENTYAYGLDSPTGFSDPLGLKVIPCIGAATGDIPDFIDPKTGKPRRTPSGKLIGECKILLACADPPATIRIYTTTITHIQPCPPCPRSCLGWIDTDTGQAVGKLVCK